MGLGGEAIWKQFKGTKSKLILWYAFIPGKIVYNFHFCVMLNRFFWIWITTLLGRLIGRSIIQRGERGAIYLIVVQMAFFPFTFEKLW